MMIPNIVLQNLSLISSHHQGNDKFNKFGSTTDMTSVTQVKTICLKVPGEYVTLIILPEL